MCYSKKKDKRERRKLIRRYEKERTNIKSNKIINIESQKIFNHKVNDTDDNNKKKCKNGYKIPI
tara:strand:+ start:199 stop:390 length:192 start_codon:yes stop_codon:yes gene_type:complete